MAFFEASPSAKAVMQGKADALYPPSIRRTAEESMAIIRAEEERYIAMMARAPGIIRRIIGAEAEVTGEVLAKIHHTHGYDPLVVEDVLSVDLPSRVHDEYQVAYARHRESGKPV